MRVLGFAALASASSVPAWKSNGRGNIPSVLDLAGAHVVGETNAEYASWNVDASYNRGFAHIAFDSPNLHAAAASLAPSSMRFGGTGNDLLVYSPFDASCDSSTDDDSKVCLNASHWRSLYNMANRSGSKIVF